MAALRVLSCSRSEFSGFIRAVILAAVVPVGGIEAGYLGDSITSSMTVHTTGISLSTPEHPYNHPLIPIEDRLSRLTLQIQLFGLQPVTLSNVPISGTVPVDFALNGSNSGTIEADNSLGGGLTLANRSQAFNGFLLAGAVETIGIGAKLTLGPETVVNRILTVDKFTPGGLTLDSGSLRFTFTGGTLASTFTAALGTNVLDIDLFVDPIGFEFSRLGTTTIAATTDDDGSGLDHDGAELNLPLAGAATTHWLNSTTPISLSGYLYLGSNVTIPEFTSLGLVSLAVAGMGACAAARRWSGFPPRRRSAVAGRGGFPTARQ